MLLLNGNIVPKDPIAIIGVPLIRADTAASTMRRHGGMVPDTRGYEIEARLCMCFLEEATEQSILVSEYIECYNFPIILAARSQKIG
jgi:hypothetical protein